MSSDLSATDLYDLSKSFSLSGLYFLVLKKVVNETGSKLPLHICPVFSTLSACVWEDEGMVYHFARGGVGTGGFDGTLVST